MSAIAERELPPSDRTKRAEERNVAGEQFGPPSEPLLGNAEELEETATLSINISGNIVTKATAQLPEAQRVLIRWLYEWALANQLTWPKLQESTGINKSTLWRVFVGKYVYPARFKSGGVSKSHPNAGLPIKLDGLCERIARLKGRIEKVHTLFSVGFLKTSVWEQMEWACGQAARKNKPVFVYSDAQVGKTAAAQEYAHQHNHGATTYLRIPPTGGVRSLLAAFAEVLHLDTRAAYDELRRNIIESLDKSKLLLIDEVHEIFITSSGKTAIRLMEEIRYIWDRTHCGMVLIGTNVFRDSFEEAAFKKFMSQWKRRGLYEIRLPAITPKGDIGVALDSYGLPWPMEGSEEAADLARLAGDGFGQLLTRLEDGKGVAEKAGDEYTWEHFITARNIVRKMALGGGK